MKEGTTATEHMFKEQNVIEEDAETPSSTHYNN